MGAPISQTVQFIAHHQGSTSPIVFVTAFGESFDFLSLLLPGTAVMVAAGLLVPNGMFHLLRLLGRAILGAGVIWTWEHSRAFRALEGDK